MKNIAKKIVFLLIFALLGFGGYFFLIVNKEASFSPINIYFTGDVHGYVEGDDERWGYSRLCDFFKEAKKNDKEAILVDVGDTFSGGGEIAFLSSGKDILEMMNTIGYDIMTVGNHDFNYGYERLLELEKMASFDIVNANVLKSGKPIFNPYIIRQIKNRKIAFIGIIGDKTRFSTNPQNIRGLDFISPKEAILKYLPKIRKNVDFVVVLSHLGEDISLITDIDGIDMIIDGHSHKELINTEINGKKVVLGGEYLKKIGHSKILVNSRKNDYEKSNKNTRFLSKDYLYQMNDMDKTRKDERILEKIKNIKDSQSGLLEKVVASIDFDIAGNLEENRTKSTMMGNLVADAMKEKSMADIAMVNGGSIRQGIKKGDIKYKDLLRIFPFANRILMKNILGKDIREALNHSISFYPKSFGGFLQISGMVVYVDEKNLKVTKIILNNGKSLKDNEKYKVAITDFLSSGGDGYDILKKGDIVQGFGDVSRAIAQKINHIGKKEKLLEQRIVLKKNK